MPEKFASVLVNPVYLLNAQECTTITKSGRSRESDSTQFKQNRHIELRIVLLHVSRPVLLAELLDHRFHSFRIGNWRCPEFRLHSPRINLNRWVLKHILVPLRVRALHGQEVELLAFQDEPDRDRNFLPRLPSDHADFNLAVPGQAFFEIVS